MLVDESADISLVLSTATSQVGEPTTSDPPPVKKRNLGSMLKADWWRKEPAGEAMSIRDTLRAWIER